MRTERMCIWERTFSSRQSPDDRHGVLEPRSDAVDPSSLNLARPGEGANLARIPFDDRDVACIEEVCGLGGQGSVQGGHEKE